MSHLLYIASNSASRKQLLHDACIPFEVIAQNADESSVSTHQNLTDIVKQIAQLKMQHAQIPSGQNEGQFAFVVTADTLGLTQDGRVLTKPANRDDAVSMIVQARLGCTTATAFCLRKLIWQQEQWVVVQERLEVCSSEYVFDVSEAFVDFYLDAVPFMNVSGAISIEGIGGQFLKGINGSYESVIGLPMFALRQALFDLGFYTHDA
jgi:septum formation protein